MDGFSVGDRVLYAFKADGLRYSGLDVGSTGTVRTLDPEHHSYGNEIGIEWDFRTNGNNLCGILGPITPNRNAGYYLPRSSLQSFNFKVKDRAVIVKAFPSKTGIFSEWFKVGMSGNVVASRRTAEHELEYSPGNWIGVDFAENADKFGRIPGHNIGGRLAGDCGYWVPDYCLRTAIATNANLCPQTKASHDWVPARNLYTKDKKQWCRACGTHE